MVTDLIKHERIRTTVGKAKVVSSCLTILAISYDQRISTFALTSKESLTATCLAAEAPG